MKKRSTVSCLRHPRTSGDWRQSPDAQSSNAELFDFLVVVLAVEDVPLLAALGDDTALGLDLEAGGLVDARLLHEQIFERLAGFLADGVAVLKEFALVGFGEDVGDDVGQLVQLVAGDSHSTALYLRASSIFTFLNISA